MFDLCQNIMSHSVNSYIQPYIEYIQTDRTKKSSYAGIGGLTILFTNQLIRVYLHNLAVHSRLPATESCVGRPQ